MDPVPSLSVIVTAYNIEAYIDHCLETMSMQTLQDIEIIVVDDGSSDATPDLILQWARRDSRVIPVLLPEASIGGVATAANAGLDIATGTYIGFMDGDDYCEPTMFAKLLDAAETYDADLAMCRYLLTDSTTGELGEPADEHRWFDVHEPFFVLDVDERKRFLQFIAVPWRKIYRRRMLEANQIRFPVGDYFYEDNPFHWFSILTARSLAVVPEVLCYHRVARVGQTMSTVDERLFRIFTHAATIRDWLSVHHLSAEYEASLLNWVISQMEWIAPRTPPELRHELFRILREIVAGYEPAVVEAAISEGRKGAVARSLTQAIVLDNYAGFAKTLDTGSAQSNPLLSARYHLRYSGVGTTAKIASRYLAQRYEDIRGPRQRSESSALGEDSSDVLFGLVLLDRRLQSIEADIEELRQSVDRLPNREA
jgi:glycosyltransferase involved in cell wall biosynthesis